MLAEPVGTDDDPEPLSIFRAAVSSRPPTREFSAPPLAEEDDCSCPICVGATAGAVIGLPLSTAVLRGLVTFDSIPGTTAGFARALVSHVPGIASTKTSLQSVEADAGGAVITVRVRPAVSKPISELVAILRLTLRAVGSRGHGFERVKYGDRAGCRPRPNCGPGRLRWNDRLSPIGERLSTSGTFAYW